MDSKKNLRTHILYVYINFISYKGEQAYHVTILYVCFLLQQLRGHEEEADWSYMIMHCIISYVIMGFAV